MEQSAEGRGHRDAAKDAQKGFCRAAEASSRALLHTFTTRRTETGTLAAYEYEGQSRAAIEIRCRQRTPPLGAEQRTYDPPRSNAGDALRDNAREQSVQRFARAEQTALH